MWCERVWEWAMWIKKSQIMEMRPGVVESRRDRNTVVICSRTVSVLHPSGLGGDSAAAAVLHVSAEDGAWRWPGMEGKGAWWDSWNWEGTGLKDLCGSRAGGSFTAACSVRPMQRARLNLAGGFNGPPLQYIREGDEGVEMKIQLLCCFPATYGHGSES